MCGGFFIPNFATLHVVFMLSDFALDLGFTFKHSFMLLIVCRNNVCSL
jgi:hypothetical protein